MGKTIARKTKAYINSTDGDEIVTVWEFNTDDPLFYKVYLMDDDESEPIIWDMGRMLFRSALNHNKLGGKSDILVTPPRSGELEVVLGNGSETVLLIFNEQIIRRFHNLSHSLVDQHQEMEFALNDLLSKVE